MNLTEFLDKNTSIMNEIEQIFIEDIFHPYAGDNGLDYIDVQTPIDDYENKKRKLDFTIKTNRYKYVIEIDGYTYHAEGAQRVSPDYFDDLLVKQNNLILTGWTLIRFSYNQIRNNPSHCINTLRRTFLGDPEINPYHLSKSSFEPTYPQAVALENINHARKLNINKGVVIIPTGMGKTILAALDSKALNTRTLFIVHRNDILNESYNKFKDVWPESTKGFFDANEKDTSSQVIFASKDTLYREGNIQKFSPTDFDLIIIDEVHHSSSLTYKKILEYFAPKYMLGLTATPERQDRADILQLFDYNIYYELSQKEAIESGYLSGFLYYGLKDDIDYNKIKHNGIKYDVADLGRKLNIPERNHAIYQKYSQYANHKKAIGFCVNIEHAISMANFFKAQGITAEAIHSDTSKLSPSLKHSYINDFRENNIKILFTVDMFNEGVDFPDVEALLFLRPTESKTIFIQQLGRGLRLCPHKTHVIVLDFIGNFKNSKNIKEILKGSSNSGNSTGSSKSQFGKKEFIDWPLGCDVIFEESVEELFKTISDAEKKVNKDDLIENYYTLKELLRKKPIQDDINNTELSKYKLSTYRNIFGSWSKFISEIGEATSASYHYPQGTHLGHIFYIIKNLGDKNSTPLTSPEVYAPTKSTLTKIGRQTRYKIWACMELGLIFDDRNPGDITDNSTFTNLTTSGHTLYKILNNSISDTTFFNLKSKDTITWELAHSAQYFNNFVKTLSPDNKNRLENIFFKMDAVQHMLKYLFHSNKNKKIFLRAEIYSTYFDTPFIKEYFDMNGIDQNSEEGAKRRLPFILNILEAFDIIEFNDRSKITIKTLPFYKFLFNDSLETLEAVKAFYSSNNIDDIPNNILTDLKILFGQDFLTDKYFL